MWHRDSLITVSLQYQLYLDGLTQEIKRENHVSFKTYTHKFKNTIWQESFMFVVTSSSEALFSLNLCEVYYANREESSSFDL